MKESFLKIRLARFLPDRPFARDIFLHLSLNQRYIRIVAAGEGISPSFLEKLAAKKVEFLHVHTREDENLDPETFQLYLLLENAQPVAEKSFRPDPADDAETKLTPSVMDPLTEAHIGAQPQRTIEETRVSGTGGVDETENRISASPPNVEPETKFSGESATLQEAAPLVIKGHEEQIKPEEFVFRDTAELQNEGAALLNRLKAALIGEKIANAAKSLMEKVNAASLKERKRHRREYAAIVEASERAAANKINSPLERNFPVEDLLSPYQSLGGATPSAELIATASERMLESLRLADHGRKALTEIDKLITESELYRDSPLLKRLENRLSSENCVEDSRQELLADIKKSVLVNKISDEILRFNASPAEKEQERRFAADLIVLERALETVAAGESPPAAIEQRFSPDKEAEELVTIFSGGDRQKSQQAAEVLHITAAKRDQAVEELSRQKRENGLLRAKSHRDMPATVSRLATYLGYSLGYSNLQMLTELGLAAILHFAKEEEGSQLHDESLPTLVKNVLENRGNEDFVTADVKEILDILRAYLANPECDREQRDFSKRVFDQTLAALSAGESAFDAINLAKWEKFVEKGPDLAGHSLCVKASASAIKQSRSIII